MQRTSLDPTVHDSWKDALHASVVNSSLPAKKLAERSASSYRHLLDCCDPASPTQLSLNRLLMLLPLMDNRAAITYLAQAAGCGLYVMPVGASADMRAAGALLKEVGEALEQVSASTEDGEITSTEFARCDKEIEDIIRAASALRETLRRRVVADVGMRAVAGGVR